MKKYANMRDTAAHCGVAPNTLRYHIARNSDFPIVSCNRGRKGWEFDLKKVDAWRAATGELMGNYFREPDPSLVLKRKYEAEWLELKLEEKRGTLVRRTEVDKIIRVKLTTLIKQLDMLPSTMRKEMKWSSITTHQFRYHLEQSRNDLIRNNPDCF